MSGGSLVRGWGGLLPVTQRIRAPGATQAWMLGRPVDIISIQVRHAVEIGGRWGVVRQFRGRVQPGKICCVQGRQHGRPCDQRKAHVQARCKRLLVQVLLPHHLHCEAALAAMDAGKHVSLQKVMTTTVADADRLVERAKTASGVFRVFENFIFYPPVMKAKELIEQGASRVSGQAGNALCRVGTQKKRLVAGLRVGADERVDRWGRWIVGRIVVDVDNAQVGDLSLCCFI